MNPEPFEAGLTPAYRSYDRQKCFIGYSEQAEWTPDLLGACDETLRRFDLEPIRAAEHFKGDVPLRQKVLELIANARYGIYDISHWRDRGGAWHMPRNVLIELGMAVALNRPALLLLHVSNPEERLPACLHGLTGHLVRFGGAATLRKELEKRLPHWVAEPPDRTWRSRACFIAGREDCEYREMHPQNQHSGPPSLPCHVADGPDADREDFRADLQEVLGHHDGVEASYPEGARPPLGYDFLICGLCQAIRTTAFGVFRVTSDTPAEAYLALGMNLALETHLCYAIPKVVVADERRLPSLLRGYEVVEARNSAERRLGLRRAVLSVLPMARKNARRPSSLPVTEGPAPPDMVLLVTALGSPPALQFTLLRNGGAEWRTFPPVLLGDAPVRLANQLFKQLGDLARHTDPAAQTRATARRLLSAREVDHRVRALGHQLWLELIPADLKELYGRERESWRGRSLLILSEESALPWEVLWPYGNGWEAEVPWCCSLRLTRWLKRTEQGDRTESPPTRLGLRALASVAPTDTGVPSFQQEGESLRVLADEHGVAYVSLEAPTWSAVLQLLERGGYDWLHMATHGTLNPEWPDSVLYLQEAATLTPAALVGPPIERHIREHRPAFLLNASHSAGWATRLVGAGAGLFVGAMWDITDDASLAFIRALYPRLLAGATVADALQQARRAARKEGDPTWLAYSVYAHPNARVELS